MRLERAYRCVDLDESLEPDPLTREPLKKELLREPPGALKRSS